jgi:DNA polymerase elongation subunit (family B)
MLQAKAVVDSRGFTIVYGDVDSLFVSRDDADRKTFEALAGEVTDATRLPMSLDKHFKWLAFLPLKRDSSSSALKRYFGVTYDNTVEARGIELRRHDTPTFIKEVQEELIRRVLDYETLSEVYSKGRQHGISFVTQMLQLIKRGEVNRDDLVVTKRLRKAAAKYKVNVAHRSAAMQLRHHGREVYVGDDVSFIISAADHRNPLCRVQVDDGYTGSYDRDAYAKLLQEAALTIFRGLNMPCTFDSKLNRLERWL